jgi:hypothetical protein
MRLRHTTILAVAASVISLLAAACSNDCPNCPGSPVAVIVSPGSAGVLVGDSLLFTALARDVNGTLLSNESAHWTSLDPGLATVGENGYVQAVSAGNARIVAQLGAIADTGIARVLTAGQVQFGRDLVPMFKATCGTAFCHTAGGNFMHLDGDSAAYAGLTAGDSLFTAGDTLTAGGGSLIRRLRADASQGDDVTKQMPQGQALRLRQPANYHLITDWIQSGALHN